jgi:hypothetical protein
MRLEEKVGALYFRARHTGHTAVTRRTAPNAHTTN